MVTLHARLHSELATTELKAVLAEDPRLTSLVENALRRARELVEQSLKSKFVVYSLANLPAISGSEQMVFMCFVVRLLFPFILTKRIP